MPISIIDMFKIGLGPSSSHSVGPMRAAKYFIIAHEEAQLEEIKTVKAELFGSLGSTGMGHGTDKAVIAGLEGFEPDSIDPTLLQERVDTIKSTGMLHISDQKHIQFSAVKDLVFYKNKNLRIHPNGMVFSSFNLEGNLILRKEYYSVGGGFVRNEHNESENPKVVRVEDLKYPFKTGQNLLDICEKHGISIAKVVMENEKAWRPEAETRSYLMQIWGVMKHAIDEGCHTEGILPGRLNVKRRAAGLYKKLKVDDSYSSDPLRVIDWVNLFAMAVSEVNASGGRVVTAPTNGAAGIIPAVLNYYRKFMNDDSDDGVVRFLATAFAIGLLFKKNASLSGAEVGCQGEVGVACSMAAAGLTEVRGGTVAQIENAAEIGIEHNLGLTCDPIGGLVQVPCIERNSMGAVKAINSSRLALNGDGKHKVHLDQAINTMLQTGADMKKKYKETSRGGLAVNVVEC